MAAITFDVNQARVEDLSIGDILDLQDHPNDMKMQMKFLAHFAVNGDGKYLEPEAAAKAVRELTLRQVMGTVNTITAQMNEAIAPKT